MASFASEVSCTQSESFFSRFGRFGGDMSLLKQLLADDERMRSWVESLLGATPVEHRPTDLDIIAIPADATVKVLIADAKAKFKRAGISFTHFNKDLLQLVRQDLELVRGKTLKVLIHNFGRGWETSEGRAFQTQQGFDGNAAAYLVWVTKTKLMGWSVSIANDDKRRFRCSDDGLYAPYFIRDDGYREFCLCGVRGRWSASRSLVAFSAI